MRWYDRKKISKSFRLVPEEAGGNSSGGASSGSDTGSTGSPVSPAHQGIGSTDRLVPENMENGGLDGVKHVKENTWDVLRKLDPETIEKRSP